MTLTLVALLSASTMYGSVEQIDELKSNELTLAKAISYFVEDNKGDIPYSYMQIKKADYLPKDFDITNIITTKKIGVTIIKDLKDEESKLLIKFDSKLNPKRISEEDKNRYLTPVKKNDFYIESSIKNNSLVTYYKMTDEALRIYKEKQAKIQKAREEYQKRVEQGLAIAENILNGAINKKPQQIETQLIMEEVKSNAN